MQLSGLELVWRVNGKGLEKLFQEFSLFIWDLHLCQGSHPAFGCLWSCWSGPKASPVDWQPSLMLACPCPHHHGAARPFRVRGPWFPSRGLILTPTHRHIPQPMLQPSPGRWPMVGAGTEAVPVVPSCPAPGCQVLHWWTTGGPWPPWIHDCFVDLYLQRHSPILCYRFLTSKSIFLKSTMQLEK